MLAGIDDILAWCRDAVKLNEQIHTAHAEHRGFASIRSNFLGMVGSGGELELYHGGLRARSASGADIFDQFDYRNYQQVIREEVRPWSYMKFPLSDPAGQGARLVSRRSAGAREQLRFHFDTAGGSGAQAFQGTRPGRFRA